MTTTQTERPAFDIAAATAFVSATARTSGLTITADALQVAAAELTGSVERDGSGAFQYLAEAGAGAFQIVDGEVREIPVERHVANVLLKHTKPVPVKVSAPVEQGVTTSPAAPSSAPMWAQRGTGAISDFARSIAEREDAAWVRESETWLNPWALGQLNRTRQQVIINKNPGLAARLKAQAGV